MQKIGIALLFALAGAVLLWGWSPWKGAPASMHVEPAVEFDPEAEVTYICRETRKLIRGPRQATPAVNPQTGRPTLVQALWCETCRDWMAAPPADYDRIGLGPRCPRHGVPL